MRKIVDLIKPYALIVFGGLLLLSTMNGLSSGDTGTIVFSVLGVIIASYYLAIGILNIIIPGKMAKLAKVLDCCNVGLYPTYLFIVLLYAVINLASNNVTISPTGWVLVITEMSASLALAVIYVLYRFLNNKVITRIAYLVAPIFILALLLTVLYDITGAATSLGNIIIADVIGYAIFTYILLSAYGDKKNAEAKEEPAEEKAEEEEVASEEPQEEEIPEETPAE
ncbi:MAG: hypothetical protein K5694_05050 [Bacilli bacterium]|nr:hypothetical protein [Bacilli bacterium]